MSVRAIVDALERTEANDRESLARVISRAALMGARGNSGVLLSQIVRGAAESFARGDDVARVLRNASDTVYAAVRVPVEGTMLTLIRELAEEAEAGGYLDAIVARGDDCVLRTREMMPLLREAGVVDSGAAGLAELVRGFAGFGSAEVPQAVSLQSVHLEPSRYRYCTSYVIEGEALDAAALERELDPLGDSVLVVGGSTALRVHVHTDEPERAIGIGALRGTVEVVEVADMYEQIAAREERLSHPVFIAVEGEGNRRLFESLGATVVDELPQSHDGVILLRDIASSVPAALSALVAYDAELSVEENVERMRAAADAVASGAVVLDDGRWLGFVGDEQVVDGADFGKVFGSVVERLLAGQRSLLTILTGAGAPPLDGALAALEARHAGLEVEVHEGGQPRSSLLVGAE